MRFFETVLAAGALFGYASADNVYTTVIEGHYTTYCPTPTTFAHKNVTYTVTEPTTLTITNCPCTVTRTGVPPHLSTKIPPPVVIPSGSNRPEVPPTAAPKPPAPVPAPPAPAPPAPEQPSRPGEPSRPEQPAQPEQPANPEKPAQPAPPGGGDNVPSAPGSPPAVPTAGADRAGIGALVLAGAAALIL